MSAAGVSSRPLEGRGIVVTRPAQQGAELIRLIESHGGRALAFPAIEILDVDDLGRVHALIDRLESFHAAIFISPNAVNKAMPVILSRRALPAGLSVIAIGGGTARELRHHGVETAIVPERYDSESLLELPVLEDVEGKRIAIFRGEGGRALLADALTARGATVEYAECYRRSRPMVDAEPLVAAWARGEIDGVVATSSEGLRNLHEMLGAQGRAQLTRTTLFVPHARIESTARELGIASVVLTQPGDGAIAAAIVRHFAAAA